VRQQRSRAFGPPHKAKRRAVPYGRCRASRGRPMSVLRNLRPRRFGTAKSARAPTINCTAETSSGGTA
jgi:ribosomal protein L15E